MDPLTKLLATSYGVLGALVGLAVLIELALYISGKVGKK